MISITFDTDHVDERLMVEFLERTRIAGSATFFCPEPYEVLEQTNHERCAHPFLDHTTDWDAELRRAREFFPDAVGFRSHSCVYSHAIALRLGSENYLYASTQDALGERWLTPRREAWGIWQLPIFYMDTLDFSTLRFWPHVEHRPFAPELIETALDEPGLYVFDFHPVHLLLNSPTAEWYLARRDELLAGAPLDEVRYPGPGAADFFALLTSRMEDGGIESVSLRQALHQHIDEGGVLRPA